MVFCGVNVSATPLTATLEKGSIMKAPLIASISLFALFAITGCESMPEKVKDDGQAAAERAKQSAEKAYKDMKEDMK